MPESDAVQESARLAALSSYDVLDTPPDGAFDRVTALAARIFNTPIALVSLVDEDRIWFKSRHGLDAEEIPRDPGLCASAIFSSDTYVIRDALSDPRALANPLVAGEFGLRFYAAAPLVTRDGYRLGTLNVIDFQARDFTDEDRRTLAELAGAVMDQMELRISSRNAVRSLSRLNRHSLEQDAEGGLDRGVTTACALTSLRLARTLESMSDGFLLLDADWSILFINAVGEGLLEREREELIGRNIWKEFPETVGSTFDVEYRRAQETGKPTCFVEYFSPLDRWFTIRTFPSDDGLAVYFRDFTGERKDRIRLREQADLLDRAQDAILVRDLKHRIIFWNAGAERLYGWRREEVLGRSIRELLYRDPAAFDEATGAVLEVGEWSGELQHLRADETTIVVEGRWSLVRNDAGEPWRIMAINTDISERKRLLSQFLRAQRLECIGTLAGGIAHDLNNVLAPILLSIEMLREEIKEEELQEILEIIESSAERGASMVNQILAFACGAEEDEVLTDLCRIARELERMVVDTFPKGIALRNEIPADLWPLVGDPTQIHQVVLNLLVNARDALPRGGEIRLRAENAELDGPFAAMSSGASPGSHVCVSVIDNGVGMPPGVVDQIFDPFFTTKGAGEGTGLGLSTVSAILRNHGGFVNVDSEVGSGTTFRVYFLARPEGIPDEETRTTSTVPRGNGECILVVEDEHSVREITRQTLEAFGYQAIVATDGADAVAIYARRQDEIDLVLMDIRMPVLDGPAAARAILRMNAEVKIIAASGLGASGGAARAMEAGVRHLLPKPYSAETLLRTIRQVLHPEVG